jgi:hypothetical protein
MIVLSIISYTFMRGSALLKLLHSCHNYACKSSESGQKEHTSCWNFDNFTRVMTVITGFKIRANIQR